MIRDRNTRVTVYPGQLNAPGIATELHFSNDEGTVSQFLERSHLRLSFMA